MSAILIPFRIYHYVIPQAQLIPVLKIISENEIRFFIEHVSDDNQILCLAISVNLTKAHQRLAPELICQVLELNTVK